MNGYNSDASQSDERITASGIVQFFWDSGDEQRHLLITIDPDDHHKPGSYELVGDIRDAVIDTIAEGTRIEIDYFVDHHEVVDPDGATTFDSHRPRILAVRILG